MLMTTEPLRHPSGYRTDWHAHATGQLCRITSGLLIIETEKGRWVVPREHIGWIPPGLRHAALSESAIEGQSLYLDSACCSALPEQPAVFEPEKLCEALFLRLCQAGEGADPKMISMLTRELAQSRQDRFRLPMPAHPRLLKIARTLLNAVDDVLPVEEYARQSGMSVRTFHRQFSAATGMNFVNWRQLARVIRAMEWLEEGKPVGWIALSCGYNSVSAFIEVFRTYTGKTPGQWGATTNPSAQT